jgi:hypothetical protein
MKIHFCDLCNESVPQADLDAGRAFVRKGRVICASCDRAMTHRAEQEGAAARSMPASASSNAYALAQAATDAPPRASVSAPEPAGAVPAGAPVKSGSGAMWMAVLGLLVTAGAIFVLDDRIHQLFGRVDAQEARSGKESRAIAALQGDQTAGVAAHKDLEARLEARAAAHSAVHESLDAKVASVSKNGEARDTEFAAMAKEVSLLKEKAGAGGMDVEKRLADLSARIAKGEDDRRLLVERLVKLESAPAPQVVAVAADPAKPAEPAWHALIEDLKSPNETTRWTAVDELGKSNDPAIAPFVVPMLKDANVFVRMGAARVLGNVQAKAAIGPLIDALEDADSPVRDAAITALKTITGKGDLKFDALSPEAERAKRVKAWREWFKKEPEAGS